MSFWTWLHSRPDTVLLRLLLTIFGWMALVIVCGFLGGEWIGLLLALLVTLLAAILFIGFFIEGLVRMVVYYRDRYREHMSSSDDPEKKL